MSPGSRARARAGAGAGAGKVRAEGSFEGKTFAVAVELRGSDVIVTPAG